MCYSRNSMSSSSEYALPLLEDRDELQTSTDQHKRPSRSDDPNLRPIPSDLNPEYRPIPRCVHILAVAFSILVAVSITVQSGVFLNDFVWLAVKTIVVYIVTRTFLQESFFTPSRVTMNELRNRYYLPSKLSHYETVTVPSDTKRTNFVDEKPVEKEDQDPSLGVHFLKYENVDVSSSNCTTPVNPSIFDALYVNHGFGSSCLCWLPILPKLAQRIRSRVGLGHDWAGFGFTERPQQSALFQTDSTARVGLELLKKHAGMEILSNECNNDESKNVRTVALMGHSMGSWTTLEMALRMPKGTRQMVVLVSPALGLVGNRSGSIEKESSSEPLQDILLWRLYGSFISTWIFPVAEFMLRRLVGCKNFWRNGLQMVWGDIELANRDVLTFQWPSIGAGWETGLLRFAPCAPIFDTSRLSDKELVRRVLDRGDTDIYMIRGSKDPLYNIGCIREFFDEFPEIKCTVMDGIGHVPIQEDIDGFIDIVENIVGDWQLKQDKPRSTK